MRRVLVGMLMIAGLGASSVVGAKEDKKQDKVAASKSCKPDEVCGSDCSNTGVTCGSFKCDCKKGTAGDKCAVYNCK